MSERLTFADPRGDTKQRPVRHVLGRGVVQEPGQNPDVRRRRDSADALRLRTSLHPNTRTAADARRVARMDFPQQKRISASAMLPLPTDKSNVLLSKRDFAVDLRFVFAILAPTVYG